MLVAGNRRTGKTQFVKNLLLQREQMTTPPINHVIWFYAAEQADVFQELKEQLGNGIEFVKGLPNTNIID